MYLLSNRHSIPNPCNISIIDVGACLTFLMLHSYQLWLWHVFANKINQEYMALTKIDTSSKKQTWHSKSLFCFFLMLQLKGSGDKRMLLFFYNQIFFLFQVPVFFFVCLFFFCFLIGIQSMQGWTANTRHGVTRKETQQRLQDTGFMDMFKKTGYNLICKLLT